VVYERAADEGRFSGNGHAAPDGHVVHDDGVLRITWTSSRPTLALAGEIDAATYPGLMAALAVTAARPGEIHLDLAGLEYCDLAGLRAMVQLTGAGEAGRDGAGQQVVLHGTPTWLATVLRIVGWDATPGLILDEGTGVRPGDRGC
jgi:anti-anti-sigma factor